MKSGVLSVDHHELPESEEDKAMLQMTQDFLLYALERDDWLMSYLGDLNESLHEKDKTLKKSHLTLIEGGLSD